MAITVVLYRHGGEVPRETAKVRQPRRTEDDVDVIVRGACVDQYVGASAQHCSYKVHRRMAATNSGLCRTYHHEEAVVVGVVVVDGRADEEMRALVAAGEGLIIVEA